jgi:hypothetical protein
LAYGFSETRLGVNISCARTNSRGTKRYKTVALFATNAFAGAIRRSHESKKRVRSATAFGQWNRNRLLRRSRVLFAHLTPGPLMGVNDLYVAVERLEMARTRPDIELVEWAALVGPRRAEVDPLLPFS